MPTKIRVPNRNQEYWLEKVQEWKKSKKSQAAFCRENGLEAKTFHCWVKKERKTKVSPIGGRQIEGAHVDFVELGLNSATNFAIKEAIMIIRTSYGSIIEVPL